MLAASVAFLGALVYGSADFLGGLAARRLRPLLVTAVAAFSGVLVLAIASPVLGGVWRAEDVAWGAASGLAGAVAVGLLYACLAIGPMSVLSPLTAVVSAVAPMLWGLLVEGERLAPIGYVGLVVAVVAIVLVAFLPGERITRPSLKAVVMAVGSGVAIGAFLILLDQTSADSGVVPLLVNRAVAGTIASVVVLVALAVAVRRGRPAASVLTSAENSPPARRAWLLASACGCVDATANLLLVVALRSGGDLAVVSALTALYPAGTVLLAAVVLREHIARVQLVGLALALTAGVLLALS
ncbi:EamA family transporter [Microbacterium sp. LjRoot45]|uniref:EamA family transporter n=1 Tax=Microbacterium sp. LjRoot45 TaxID=3342329 RepID=UPI003ECF87C2